MQPELLLLDEVTSALDPELVAEVLDVIRELAAGGMTMVIATHEMGFARDIASKVCFLDAGQILEEGPPEQIFSAPREERTQQFLQRIVDAGPSVGPQPGSTIRDLCLERVGSVQEHRFVARAARRVHRHPARQRRDRDPRRV